MQLLSPYNNARFFDSLKPILFTKFTKLQVLSISTILDVCQLQNVTNIKHIAYILATAYHECHNPKSPELRLTPMVEVGTLKYLKSKKYYPYIGRGFSQLTWHANYLKGTIYLQSFGYDVDLVKNPDLILNVNYSAMLHVFAMRTGMYTGKKLANYRNFVSMRKIINPDNKGILVATYADAFLKCLSTSYGKFAV